MTNYKRVGQNRNNKILNTSFPHPSSRAHLRFYPTSHVVPGVGGTQDAGVVSLGSLHVVLAACSSWETLLTVPVFQRNKSTVVRKD